MNKRLSQYFTLNRRYARSINLERDLDVPEALEGYILTERSLDALKRILGGMSDPQSNRAWTLTSVYGTGKSAFAHYLASLCAPATHPTRQLAQQIADRALNSESLDYQHLTEHIPNQGLFRAVVVAQREPLSHTIVRALYQGCEVFWDAAKRNKQAINRTLVDLYEDVTSGKIIPNNKILGLVQEVAKASETGILIIIDELGKNLEFAAYNQGEQDLYLLQQLAELPKSKGYQVYIVGILHQAFADYGEKLSSVQRNEWAKIQGRFEDIAFKDSSAQMMKLIGQVIDSSGADIFQEDIANQVSEWFEYLPQNLTSDIAKSVLASTYPLHPITASVLPILCTRYAQNDRSLFTFLTSDEPYSLKKFLEETEIENKVLSSLKLDRIYDYFVEAVGMGFSSRPNLQKWVEVQGLIGDAKGLDSDNLRILKVIGMLNLVTSTGALRATRTLVRLAMCDSVNESEISHWEDVIENILKQGLITHRRQVDELRIWQGSDFNIDIELANNLDKSRSHLVDLLAEIRPLKPMVAQRHSYKTGTLRYFELRYLDDRTNLANLSCSNSNYDGLVGYWIDRKLPEAVPATTVDGKPLIVLCAVKLDLLGTRAQEFAALKKIQSSAAQLQTDGVARREVRYRLVLAEQLLDETLSQVFDLAAHQNPYWVRGKSETITHSKYFNAKLSDVCDEVYSQGLVLWNELINRRELTSQGTKARRELIEAMLQHPEKERLGLEGYGPEVSMYYSVLGETGIHRAEGEVWGFCPPLEQSGVWTLWQAIEEFCLRSKERQQALDILYKELEAPPYGVKLGVIPVLLLAVLLYHTDDVGVYKDGTFIPVLGTEHFELLLKEPLRFAVKYFEVVGLRSQVFKELEAILRQPNTQIPPGVRNATLLAVVKPLFQFAKKLPAYTNKTKRLSVEAQAVLQTLQQAQEPDELLFTSLPVACGLPAIVAQDEDDGMTARLLRKKLAQALHEIQTAYDRLLSECQELLHNAFAIRTGEAKLREDLRVRASYITGQSLERSLKSFTQAVTDESAGNKEWLEALIMIVADKPAESWKDEDVTAFEIKLSDLARRFKNLEALQKNVEAKGESFEAMRITLTRPDGQEVHQMVWVDHDHQSEIENLVDEILSKPILRHNTQLQQALVAKLTERVLQSTNQNEIDRSQGKRQGTKYDRETS